MRWRFIVNSQDFKRFMGNGDGRRNYEATSSIIECREVHAAGDTFRVGLYVSLAGCFKCKRRNEARLGRQLQMQQTGL
ncbi:Protein of unknown function, partial [Gryllus bimaculatus]